MNNDLAELGAGPTEDGWDAIEHAIAEYDFREGSVPVIVLVQGDQGRTILNDTLTRTGILAALQSKNAILNSILAGQLLADGEPPTGFVDEPLLFRDGSNQSDPPLDPQPIASWAPIFDLATYGLNEDIYVLGVEADSADGVRDWTHDFHWFDTDTINTTTDVPVATAADALQVSYNGSNTGATGMVGTGKSILIGQSIAGGIGGGASEAPARSFLLLLATLGVFAPCPFRTRASLGRNCYNRGRICLTAPPPC